MSAVPDDLAGESKFQTWTRVGFAARGLLYIVIALLVLGTGRTEDLTGALEYLNEGVGELLLMVLAGGLATYGLWRLADAGFGIENPAADGRALRKRSAAGVVGVIYLYLAYKAARILLDGDPGQASTQQQADTVLDLPGGRWVLAFAALVLAIAGAYQLRNAITCSFLTRLGVAAQAPVVKWLGRIGYASRGVIFLAVAVLIARAAIDDKSTEAGGIEQVLDLLSGPVLYGVAAGLMLFGMFSIIEARYRRIHDAPMEEIKQQMRDVGP
ncbi:DUF1206 domain-containing protein [Sphingomonas sp.]|uniref:DUF1206 domain-containing protein n=1 Tax=Sphingomonas sp. TaxID=28214 RepID=UPI00185AC45B|nr:DUF1206 domain-containing protein [Sphingomonas sp.]MBA3511732.1 DUF1206 domain-containing protein [Sphingomonas sp.]